MYICLRLCWCVCVPLCVSVFVLFLYLHFLCGCFCVCEARQHGASSPFLALCALDSYNPTSVRQPVGVQSHRWKVLVVDGNWKLLLSFNQ